MNLVYNERSYYKLNLSTNPMFENTSLDMSQNGLIQ